MSIKKRIILFIFINIVIFGYLFLFRNSYAFERLDYLSLMNNSNEDIIGSIKIDSLNIDCNLLQGLDDEFYLNKDENKNINDIGSIFIGYETDLNRKQTNLLYIPYNEEYNLVDKDIININYLGDELLFEVNNSSKNKDKLIINFYKDGKVIEKIVSVRK